MKDENFDEKKEPLIISNNTSNDFLLLFSNIKEQIKLLKSYIDYIKEYFDIISVFSKQLDEVNKKNFLNENKCKSQTMNSPIFFLGKAIKEIIQLQINNLLKIINNEQVFNDITKEFSDLINILKEYKNTYGDASKDKDKPRSQIQPVLLSLMETFGDIEYKVIDDYVTKKYDKKIVGEKDINLPNKLEEAHFLEKTFVEFEERSKITFIQEFKEIKGKTLNYFNIIKNNMKKIAEIILKQNHINLYEIQNKIDCIGKVDELKDYDNDKDNNDQKDEQNLKIPTKNEDIFKYRIKIIGNPKVEIINNEIEKQNNLPSKNGEKKLEKKKTFIHRSKTDLKEKEEKKEETIKIEISLTDEDIYNIVETLYNYDLKMLDKSSYILDIEKKKIEFVNLCKKLISFDLKKNQPEKISDAEADKLIELLSNKENIYKFFILLNNYRSTGNCETTERAYDLIVKIFKIAQDYLMTNRHQSIENLVIIMSQTFYVKKNGEKIFLINSVKDHPLFKKKEFWERQIIDKIDKLIEKTKKDMEKMDIILNEKELQKRIDEIVFSQFVPISTHMYDFELPNEIILEIANKAFEAYNVSNETKALILSLLKIENK